MALGLLLTLTAFDTVPVALLVEDWLDGCTRLLVLEGALLTMVLPTVGWR